MNFTAKEVKVPSYEYGLVAITKPINISEKKKGTICKFPDLEGQLMDYIPAFKDGRFVFPSRDILKSFYWATFPWRGGGLF